jgi:hypothetical protein
MSTASSGNTSVRAAANSSYFVWKIASIGTLI